MLPQQVKDMLRDLTCAERICNRRDGRQDYALLGVDSRVQRRRSCGFNRDYGNIIQAVAAQALDNASKEPAAAYACYHAVKLRPTLDHLVDQCCMTFPKKRMIIRVHIGSLPFSCA